MSGARQNWRIGRLKLHADLVAERRAQRIRQVDMARRIGVSRRTFQRIESAELEPSGDDLFRWADALGFEITITRAAPAAAVTEVAA